MSKTKRFYTDGLDCSIAVKIRDRNRQEHGDDAVVVLLMDSEWGGDATKEANRLCRLLNRGGDTALARVMEACDAS